MDNIECLQNQCIHQLFEKQVEKNPENIAVVFEDKSLTYGNLNKKSNKLAWYLREKGIKPDDIIAIMANRSPEMITGILGILKAGAAYLPMDNDYPVEGLRYFLQNSMCKLILCQEELSSDFLYEEEIPVIYPDRDWKEIEHYPELNPENINSVNDLAYVIYTSGSTGRPKGVMIEHHGTVNRIIWMQKEYKLTEEDRVLQKTPFSFDVSVSEIFWPLLTGSVLCFAKPEGHKDPVYLTEAIEKYNITTIHFVPSMLKIFLDTLDQNKKNLASLRRIICSGEGLRRNLSDECEKMLSCELHNLYGPTEATVYASYWDCRLKIHRDCPIVPIGKPVDNIRLYILDGRLNPVPDGVTGELYISGAGLARGYLNSPVLTEERFIENVLVSKEERKLTCYNRLYKTGDMVRRLSDGAIEYLGRSDFQIKIRGLRIEPGEIETHLATCEQIKESAVIAREDKSGNKYLCAYYVSDRKISSHDLRKHLLKVLPYYMLPFFYIRLEKLPLTSNGKLDRKALPEPALMMTGENEYVAPRNNNEAKLAGIWQEILQTEVTGIHDNFFETGGDSLKAMTLISRIHKEFNIKFAVKDIFLLPTIEKLSELIENSNQTIYKTIEKLEERDYYDLSSAQKRLYLLNQMEEGSSITYNIPLAMVIEGRLDLNRFVDSVNYIIKRHETLRTSFDFINDEPVQIIHKEVKIKPEYLEAEDITSEMFRNFLRPFDLRNAPLLRLKLIKTNEERHVMFLDIHHIISDGTSIEIFIKELQTFYQGKDLRPLKIQYKDYSYWQNNLFRSDSIKKQEEFWINTLNGELPILNMPLDYMRPSVHSSEGGCVRFKLDRDMTGKLKSLCFKTGTTLYMLLLAAYNVILYRYTGQEDIIIASPVAGRRHIDIDGLIGLFVNTIPMRNYPHGDKKFTEFLTDIKENTIKALGNQDYPFEEMVNKLKIRRDISRNPVFDTMFTYENSDDFTGGELNISYADIEHNTSKFDITLYALDEKYEICCEFTYCRKLFRRDTIERFRDCFINLLTDIVKNPESRLREIEILNKEDRNLILYNFNNTKAEYPEEKTVYQLFEEQVEKTPDNIAVVYKEKKLTYKEVNEKANQLARELRNNGVKPDEPVAIVVKRTPEMIIGIMGILKSGGCYVPVDPAYPEQRITFILNDCRARILLTRKGLYENISFDGKIIDLKDENIYRGDTSNPEIINNPYDLIYIIYTSGTTGTPKGVMIEHRSVVNFILWYKDFSELTEKDNTTQFLTYGFDASVREIFSPLLSGSSLHIISDDIRYSPWELNDYYEKHNITVSYLPTKYAEQFMKLTDNKSLRHLNTGGDKLRKVTKRSYKVGNNYGPTETTVCSTALIIDKDYKDIPAGKPVNNTRIYIVDKYQSLQPIGVLGEICITGDGLSRGYLNLAELTEEKFIKNPFEPGKRMYRTGDIGRWLPDGNIEFFGRMDHQIKIRGYRIEVAEIEQVLLKKKDIKNTAVIAREDGNRDKYICAYIVSDRETDTDLLKKELSLELPDYMLPRFIMQIEELPLNSHSKLDREALPEPVITDKPATPANEIEMKLIEIWKEVLGIERCGVNDDFFTSGGDSLKAAIIQSKIEKVFNQRIPIKEIFRLPAIRQLRDIIPDLKGSSYPEVRSVEKRRYYSPSSAQKRLFTLDEMEDTGISYNMSFIITIEGKLDINRFKNSLKTMFKRHESLRTYFDTDNGLVQKIGDFELEIYYENSNEADINHIVEKFIKPFNLKEGPLFKVKITGLSKEKNILLIDVHHIIFDAFSFNIFFKEVFLLYEGKDLKPLPCQYKEFALWQDELLKSDVIKSQEEFWMHKFSGEIPVLNLPTDYTRRPVHIFTGDEYIFSLDDKLTLQLKELAGTQGMTLSLLLLAAFNILMAKYSSQEDIITGVPVLGRRKEEFMNTIGMFVNVLPIRNYPSGEKSFHEFLLEVKKNFLEAYDNQDYQLEYMLEKLKIKRIPGRNSLFDVVFALYNLETPDIHAEGLKLSWNYIGLDKNKFDLVMDIKEEGKKINIILEYGTVLFKRETIEKMASHYINILKEVCNVPEVKIKDINILSEREKRKVLYEFNKTEKAYHKDMCLHALFQEQVEKTPEKIAVVFKDKKLTYRELNEKASSLGRLLRNYGIKGDIPVCIMVEPSLERITGIMAILKSGGAYVPIEADYPPERIKHILKDTASPVILTKKHLFSKVEFSGFTVDLEDENLYKGETLNPEFINKPSDLAYIIYTSGSTGRPKGVLIEHRSIVNLSLYYKDLYNITEKDNMTHYASFSFDASVWEIFISLLSGSTLHITDDDIRFSPYELNEYFEKNNITIAFLPTQFAEKFMELTDNKSLRYLAIAGDRLKIYYKRKYEIFNNYGPTECTVGSTNFIVDKEYENIPIGKPVADRKIYILDRFNKLQPPGIPGELCIGGDGLARGYLNSPALTKEKFIKNPFEPGERMYRTGDLARWLSDGNIEFLGRMDEQVKIRGFRIEPGEIESLLAKYEQIKDSVVKIIEDRSGGKFLCAYYVSDYIIKPHELKHYLSQNLPPYMIPSFFVQIEKIPLTHSGKIDRKALIAPEIKGENPAPPENETQRKLVKIWEETLGISNTGIDENFFNLGGHSLTALNIQVKIKKDLDITLSLKEIFAFPTIRQISEIIFQRKNSHRGGATEFPGESKERGNNFPEIKSVEEREYYPLSSAQKRLFAIEQFGNMGTAYNIPIVLIIKGRPDIEKIYNNFQSLIERHEAFRTFFDVIDGQAVQKIHKNLQLNINYSENRESNLKDIISEFITPFDLKKLPLFRFKIVRLCEEKHLFLMDIHHIIFDGTSSSIFLKELFLLYEGMELEPLKYQFKDFSVWQNKLLKSEFIKKQEEFWVNKFSDELPVLELPLDYPRPSVQNFSGKKLTLLIEKDLSDDLKKLALNTGSTLYMVLMAALNILLAKYSSQEDIVTGVPLAGRVIEDIKGTAGMFVNILPMRSHPEGEKTFKVFLEEIRKNLMEIYENQDYQIELLINKLKIKKNFRRNPLFDIVFVLQNMEKIQFHVKELNIKEYFYNGKTSKFDISFLAEEQHDGIEFKLEYCTDLFKCNTISRMAEHFKNILKKISSHMEKKIRHIDILTDEEKKQLLYDFNRTNMVYSGNKSIIELFEEQAEKTPHNIAVVFEDKQLTYEELNRKANQIARLLRNKGIKPDMPAAILVTPSPEMIVSVIGVLKSGGTYVPLAHDYPLKRLKSIICDTGSKVLLSQKGLFERINFSGIIIDLEDEKNYQGDNSNLPVVNTREHLAYIIYTSGSTGTPQGVMIEHRSLTNFCLWYKEDRNLTEKDNIPYLSNFAFDASIMEMFPPLIAGSTIHIIDYDTKLSIYALNDYFEKNLITGAFMTTRFGEEFITMIENKSLKWLDIGGEKLRIYRKKNYIIRNVYGPTECTVYTTGFIIDRDYDNIPIGKPVAKSKIFIVDKFNNLQPAGVPGELCVSGDCLSRGYFKRPDLTEEKFMENPFIPGERMYKTGDLARWLPNGNIEFIGRRDEQIKIRGFRIEPGEIEQIMLKHHGIRDIAVISREDTDGHKYLCAYIVSDKEINIKNLKSLLTEEIPDYMIPSYIMQIPEIPLTSNGKIDRQALPAPEFRDMTATYLAPEDEIQRKLVKIWEEVLDIRSIGIRDNFFELGGNSIMAVKLFARISRVFGRDISPSILFKGANIEYLSDILRGKKMNSQWKHLVEIQPGGNKLPLYCVTPVGDESIFYLNLVKYLRPDQPFYSLQVHLNEFKSIEGLASDYIKEIQILQPEGPYFLGGFSSGGIVAFEMAQQLHKKEHKVAPIFMFDRGISMPWTPELIIKSIFNFPCWLHNFSKEPFKLQCERICRGIKRIKIMLLSLFRLYKKPVTVKDMVDIEQFIKNYPTKPYHGSIIVFASCTKPLISASSHYHDLGWRKVVTGGVEVKVLPGSSHMEMFKEPHVKLLAEQVNECLDKAQNYFISENDITFPVIKS